MVYFLRCGSKIERAMKMKPCIRPTFEASFFSNYFYNRKGPKFPSYLLTRFPQFPKKLLLKLWLLQWRILGILDEERMSQPLRRGRKLIIWQVLCGKTAWKWNNLDQGERGLTHTILDHGNFELNYKLIIEFIIRRNTVSADISHYVDVFRFCVLG